MFFSSLLFCLIPLNPPSLIEYHDVAEINQVYDEKGHRKFTQVIWRDLNSYTGMMEIIDFRVINRSLSKREKVERDKWEFNNPGISWNPPLKSNSLYPKMIRYRSGYSYHSAFWDKSDEVYRKIFVKSLIWTHSNYDLELLEREKFPKYQRRGLKRWLKSLPKR